MLGLLCWEEWRWGKVRLREMRVMDLPVLQAQLARNGRWEKRLERAAGLLSGRGVYRVLPMRGFRDWDVPARRGVTAVDPLPLYRAMAAELVLAQLERTGLKPERAAVTLRGERLDGALVGAARQLCPKVRDLVVDVPHGGWKLAGELYREYGVAVCPRGEQGTDVEVCFGGAAGERALGLSGEDLQLRGLQVLARERVLPEELEHAPLLTALWQNGRLEMEELQVRF